MKPARFDYERASDTRAAISLLRGDSKVLAGGQSLGPMLNLRIAQPERVVDVRQCADRLRGEGAQEFPQRLGIGGVRRPHDLERNELPLRGPLPFARDDRLEDFDHHLR